MVGDGEERPRILGFPVGERPGPPGRGESERILGMPVDWFGPVDVAWFRSIAHPVRSWRRWRRHRRLGPYALDDDEQDPAGPAGPAGPPPGGPAPTELS